eukprot:5780929-Amphidinium_carterae.3
MLIPEDERATIWASGCIPPKYTPPTRMDMPPSGQIPEYLGSNAIRICSTGAVIANPELEHRPLANPPSKRDE